MYPSTDEAFQFYVKLGSVKIRVVRVGYVSKLI
jgi:hypothetical protein